MSNDTILDLLKELHFTQDFEPQYLEKLAQLARTAYFPPNDALFKEGDMGDTIYLITEGQVSIEFYVPGRGPIKVMTLSAGELVGWSPFFAGKLYTATARALIPTHVLAFNGTDLQVLCQVDHALGCVLAWRVAEVVTGRLKATRLQLLDIFASAD
ncbi:MAG: hypothetical protein FOGNACKC_03279 [Anaerolineae bacterium]|nr:hypothetical protein [Anaerolineae bacterium]